MTIDNDLNKIIIPWSVIPSSIEQIYVKMGSGSSKHWSRLQALVHGCYGDWRQACIVHEPDAFMRLREMQHALYNWATLSIVDDSDEHTRCTLHDVVFGMKPRPSEDQNIVISGGSPTSRSSSAAAWRGSRPAKWSTNAVRPDNFFLSLPPDPMSSTQKPWIRKNSRNSFF